MPKQRKHVLDFFFKSLLESPGNLQICSVKFVVTDVWDGQLPVLHNVLTTAAYADTVSVVFVFGYLLEWIRHDYCTDSSSKSCIVSVVWTETSCR